MSSLEYTLDDGKTISLDKVSERLLNINIQKDGKLVDDIMMDIHMLADIALNDRKKLDFMLKERNKMGKYMQNESQE